MLCNGCAGNKCPVCANPSRKQFNPAFVLAILSITMLVLIGVLRVVL